MCVKSQKVQRESLWGIAIDDVLADGVEDYLTAQKKKQKD